MIFGHEFRITAMVVLTGGTANASFYWIEVDITNYGKKIVSIFYHLTLKSILEEMPNTFVCLVEIHGIGLRDARNDSSQIRFIRLYQ